MMRKMMNWMLVAILICSASVMTSCKEKQAQQDQENTAEVQVVDSVKKVVSEELIRTSKSWDGVDLPDYFQGKPELWL